jgi:hypothetical protein
LAEGANVEELGGGFTETGDGLDFDDPPKIREMTKKATTKTANAMAKVMASRLGDSFGFVCKWSFPSDSDMGNNLLQVFGGLELEKTAGRDFDFLTRGGIAALASSFLDDIKSAEGRQRNLIAFGYSISNGMHDMRERLFCVFLGGTRIAGQQLNELGFVHDDKLLVAVANAWPRANLYYTSVYCASKTSDF